MSTFKKAHINFRDTFTVSELRSFRNDLGNFFISGIKYHIRYLNNMIAFFDNKEYLLHTEVIKNNVIDWDDFNAYPPHITQEVKNKIDKIVAIKAFI